MVLKTSIICGNVTMIDQAITPSTVELVVTQAPNFHRTGKTVTEYVAWMHDAFRGCYNVLQRGHYMALIVPSMVDESGQPANIAARLAVELEAVGFTFGEHITVISTGYIAQRSTKFKKTKGKPRTYKPNVVSGDVYLFYKGASPANRFDKEWTKFIYKRAVSKGINTLDNYTDIGAKDQVSGIEYYQDWLLTNVWRTQDSIARLLIQLLSYKGEVVLDPFAVTGDTMKQAQLLDRSVCGLVAGQPGVKMLQRKLGYGMPSLIPEDEKREFETKSVE